MLTLRKQKGEWIEIGALLTNPKTRGPVDATGCTISVVVRSGPKGTDTQVVTATGSFDNAPGGDGSVGFLIANPGTYYGTVTVDKGGAPGWPVKEEAQIIISDCP